MLEAPSVPVVGRIFKAGDVFTMLAISRTRPGMKMTPKRFGVQRNVMVTSAASGLGEAKTWESPGAGAASVMRQLLQTSVPSDSFPPGHKGKLLLPAWKPTCL